MQTLKNRYNFHGWERDPTCCRVVVLLIYDYEKIIKNLTKDGKREISEYHYVIMVQFCNLFVHIYILACVVVVFVRYAKVNKKLFVTRRKENFVILYLIIF